MKHKFTIWEPDLENESDGVEAEIEAAGSVPLFSKYSDPLFSNISEYIERFCSIRDFRRVEWPPYRVILARTKGRDAIRFEVECRQEPVYLVRLAPGKP